MSTQDELLSPEQVSNYFGGCISKQTLARWRHEGRGPRHVKLGGRVAYRLSAVEEFLKSRERRQASAA